MREVGEVGPGRPGWSPTQVYPARPPCDPDLLGLTPTSLRGCRTDRTAGDDSNGPEQRPQVLPKAAQGTGRSSSLFSTHKASMLVTNLSY